MRKISEKVKNEILADDYYDKCARKDEGDCKGRITWEHALTYQGKQIDAKWAIIPICAFHHSVDQYQDSGKMDKDKHQWIALNRISDNDIIFLYPKSDFIQRKKYLNGKFGS